MLKPSPSSDQLYGQQPRKRIKVNVALDENYNEFKGDFIQDPALDPKDQKGDKLEEKKIKFESFEQQTARNKSIYEVIKNSEKKVRKINDACLSKSEQKIQENQKTLKEEKKSEQSRKIPDKKQKKESKQCKVIPTLKSQQKKNKIATGQSNWQKFMSQTSAKSQHSLKQIKVSQNEAVAIDCQFVKGEDQQLLARISIVNDRGQCLLDSYVRPEKKISDYLTDITGISFLHIKNAPKAGEVLQKAKKIMYNKIVVGHTVWKDLQVCGLKQWKGWKALVDISEFEAFKEKNGKLISLKNLTLRHLGRSIQEGRHSSVEDAMATIDLFKIRKMEILKQSKVIV